MFAYDGFLYRICEVFYRFVVLNLLYLIFCLPIITIPAATAGLFGVSRRLVYRQEISILRSFWTAFRSNMAQSTVVGLAFLVVALLWRLDVHFTSNHHASGAAFITFAQVIIALILLSTLLHIYPLMVHTKSTSIQLVINAIRLSLIRPLFTLLNLTFVGILLYLAFRMPLLFIFLFFSLFATVTYWLVDKKFTLVNGNVDDKGSAQHSNSI